jgi:hypothetical protein
LLPVRFLSASFFLDFDDELLPCSDAAARPFEWHELLDLSVQQQQQQQFLTLHPGALLTSSFLPASLVILVGVCV